MSEAGRGFIVWYIAMFFSFAVMMSGAYSFLGGDRSTLSWFALLGGGGAFATVQVLGAGKQEKAQGGQ